MGSEELEMSATRHRFLQIGGAIGFVGIAGCLDQETMERLQGAQDEGTRTDGNSGTDEHSGMNDSQSAGGTEAYNDADVMFLQMMIPHHEGAVEMARLVPDRTDRQELLDLSTTIVSEQEREIDQMRLMLEEAGDDATGTTNTGMGMDHGNASDEDHMDMPGSMDPSEMEELRSLRGREFDLMFSGMMIEHHQGAITMAENVIETGRSPKVEQLARKIVSDQRAEIERMRQWRCEWSG